MPNSLLSGKIQGISPIRASAAPRTRRKRALNQVLTSQFPTHPNREFFCRVQGIKSGDQGKFRPDQGIPLSSAIWAFALPTIRSSRQISNLSGKANRDAARCSEVAEDDLELRVVHPQGCRKSLTERVDAHGRAFRASRWRRGSRRTRLSAPNSRRGGPRVRIHLPPAESQQRTRTGPRAAYRRSRRRAARRA